MYLLGYLWLYECHGVWSIYCGDADLRQMSIQTLILQWRWFLSLEDSKGDTHGWKVQTEGFTSTPSRGIFVRSGDTK